MAKKAILVVDDEPAIRLLVKNMLDKSYQVYLATDGQEAIDITRRTKPALILMDIMMPKVDGYTACRTIKTDDETKNIPVIMVTGVGYDLNKKLSEGVGAADYITKPFNPSDLLEKINSLID